MEAGKLDRRVTLQRKVITQSSSGAQVESWRDIAVVWAQETSMRGAERFSVQQITGKALSTFLIRYRSDVTVQDRISYAGRAWDITDTREIGRREALEIDAWARADT